MQWAKNSFLTVKIPYDKQGEDDGDEEGVLAKWIWLILEYEYLACAIYRPFKMITMPTKEWSGLIIYSCHTLHDYTNAISRYVVPGHKMLDIGGVYIRTHGLRADLTLHQA